MKCVYCKGEMLRGSAPFSVDRHGFHLRLDAVPAWVCSQCGEACFEEHEVTAIQEALRAIEERAGSLCAAT